MVKRPASDVLPCTAQMPGVFLLLPASPVPWFSAAGSGIDRRDRRPILLPGPDPVPLLEGEHEDLAIAPVAGAAPCRDGANGGLHEMIRHADLEPYLVMQLDLHGHAAVRLDDLGF